MQFVKKTRSGVSILGLTLKLTLALILFLAIVFLLNKIDLIDKEEILKITNKLKKKIKTKIFIISTVKKEGLLDLKKILISNVYK